MIFLAFLCYNRFKNYHRITKRRFFATVAKTLLMGGIVSVRVNRLDAMEQYIIDCGAVSLEDIAQEFNISTNTVRRDIQELLSRKNSIKKVYGGVAANAEFPQPYTSRAADHGKGKEEIGRLAAAFVEDGDAIYLDSGTTTPCMVKHLKNHRNITVLTNNLAVMTECALYPNITLITLGGVFDIHTSSFMGSIPLEALSRFTVKTVFLAATGVSICAGLTNSTYMEAEMKRAVSKVGERCILLADESKFGQAAAVKFYSFNDLYAIVTDSPPAQTYFEISEKFGIQLIYPGAVGEDSFGKGANAVPV